MSPENNIQKNVLDKIHVGGVSMRSRFYFIFRAILLSIAAFSVLAVSFFVLSFVFFDVYESGTRFLLEFNTAGIMTFFTVFPWYSLLLALILFVLLEAVLRHFRFGYRLPLLRVFLWIVIIGIIGSQILNLTPLHPFLLSEADNDRLPIIGSWYEQIHDSHRDKGIYRGHITEIHEAYFLLSHDDFDHDADDTSWRIIPPFEFDIQTLSIGDSVYVAGQMQGESVAAYGIRRIKTVTE